MPAIAAITLANGETSPVSHVFNPLGFDVKTGIWWYEDQSPRVASSASLGYPRLGLRTKRDIEMTAGSTARTTVARVEVTIALPQLETLGTGANGFTPAPTVAYVDRVKVEFILSSRDTIGDRKDALAFAKNTLANASVVDLVHNLSALY